MTTTPLKRTIGFYTAVSLVAGTIIGAGIFMRPAEMAALLGSPYLVLLVWLISGLFTLIIAMIFAEIGAMIPDTGGPYAYLQKIYGDFWAYLFGWANFAVINTASNAAVAFIFSQYLEYFVTFPRFSTPVEHSLQLHLPMIGDIYPLENFGVKAMTILILCVFSFIGYVSTKAGGLLQRIFTYTKVLAITLLIFGLFFSGKGHFQHFFTDDLSIKPVGFALMAALVAASTGALQAFDGAQTMLYISGEIKDPKKNIPRSLIIGVLITIVVYISISAAMIYVLPVGSMAKSSLVASDAAKISFGVIGGGIVAALICLNVLGGLNGAVYTSPRITFAMAERKQFFSSAAVVHRKFQTPANAFLFHLVWMILLVLSGSFNILADMYIFIVWLFNLLLICCIFILRSKMPTAERPYKIIAYPWLPILALLFSIFYLGITVYNDVHNYIIGKSHIMNSVFGIVLTALGIPLFYYFRSRSGKKNLKDR